MVKKKFTEEEQEGCNVLSLPTPSVCEKEKDFSQKNMLTTCRGSEKPISWNAPAGEMHPSNTKIDTRQIRPSTCPSKNEQHVVTIRSLLSLTVFDHPKMKRVTLHNVLHYRLCQLGLLSSGAKAPLLPFTFHLMLWEKGFGPERRGRIGNLSRG